MQEWIIGFSLKDLEFQCPPACPAPPLPLVAKREVPQYGRDGLQGSGVGEGAQGAPDKHRAMRPLRHDQPTGTAEGEIGERFWFGKGSERGGTYFGALYRVFLVVEDRSAVN